MEIISYGDLMIGKWGGLKLHLTGLDKEAAIADLMSDDLAKAVLENITFDEASKDDAVSIPGISATFPATWKSGTSEPMGIYAGKTTSLEEIPDGAVIAVPNDATNEGRALLLLQDLGLIELKEDAGLEATPNDITSAPAWPPSSPAWRCPACASPSP